MRPGRLDRILYVGPPDFEGRQEVIQIQTRGMAVDPALDINTLASIVRTSLRRKLLHCL
jgi:AAA family ATPase